LLNIVLSKTESAEKELHNSSTVPWGHFEL